MDGYLDFVRDCGAAPDAKMQPHGVGARQILSWTPYAHDEATGQTIWKYKMVLWPRGSFKSQVFDVGLVCWLIACNPDVRVLICSETGKQARTFFKKVMEIISSPWFEERFGVHKNPKAWSVSQGFVSAQRTRREIKEPTCLATGVGEVRTGMHWDFVIMDDVVSQENTRTEEAIESTFHWFGETLAQLDPGCRLLMIGTLHHFADLYCRIQKTPEMRKLFEFSIHSWRNPDGSLFFPARITEQFVAQQKALMPPRMFACFYENRPQASEDQIFLPEYFHVIEDHDIPRNVWSYIFTDFAFIGGEKAKDHNDRTAFWLVSLDANRVAYVRDFIVGRWKPSDSVRIACALWDANQHLHLKGITIEDTTHKELLQSLFEEIRRQTNTRPRIISIQGRNQEIKDMRIESVEPRFRRGDIYFARALREQHKKWNALIDEMVEWPFSAHDDIPDAISDIDKRDRQGKLYCPGPPIGWRAANAPRWEPPTVSGRFNPDFPHPARESARAAQQRPVGDLWSGSGTSQAPSIWTPQIMRPI